MEPIKVLIVDDEVEFLETVVKRLRKRNLDATGVTSGEAALDQLAKGPVDVVVLDVKMRGISGLETLREIKRKHHPVEVIMLTGHASMEAAMQGMALGAFDYLMKPAQIDELVGKIEDARRTLTLAEKRHELGPRAVTNS
jgi:DNA-binding response OmpR family regulator